MRKGIICSIQNFEPVVTVALAKMAVNSGAVAIRTDSPIFSRAPVIGLVKSDVLGKHSLPYITVDESSIFYVSKFAELVAIDSRRINTKLPELCAVAKDLGLQIVCDIQNREDYFNLLTEEIEFDFLATTFSVFDQGANVKLIEDLLKIDETLKVIAEGGFEYLEDVVMAFEAGAHNVCIGNAFFNFQEKIKLYKRAINDFCG